MRISEEVHDAIRAITERPYKAPSVAEKYRAKVRVLEDLILQINDQLQPATGLDTDTNELLSMVVDTLRQEPPKPDGE